MNGGKNLLEKIKARTAVVGIIGVGYVGNALSRGTINAGFKTIGFTRRESKAHEINNENIKNYIGTTDLNLLSDCDIICICVPTPIHEDKKPDLEPLLNALSNTLNHFKKNTLVIIESTIAPGTTRSLALPFLKKSGFLEEEDFFLSFSPERVDPGNENYNIFNTPKVISGLSPISLELSKTFYESFVEKVVPVSTLEVAEMSKILENTFRFVNISLMNELLSYTNGLKINLWETVDAAATKPFGFLPHYPGPGIGGHCIPVDPYYLLDDARNKGINLGIIESAGRVNDAQPKKIVDRAIDIINKTNGHKINHSALLVGLSYKEDTPDQRESPSFKIWELLKESNISVSYHDPYIPNYEDSISSELSETTIKDIDIIILATPHRIINYEELISFNRPILDSKNALKYHTSPNIYKI